MLVTLNKKRTVFIKNNLKKNYFFHTLICLQSRIKFKHKNQLILIKVNNNISILKKKSRYIFIKIIENKIFLYSENRQQISELIKNLSIFCKSITFL